MNVCKMNDKFPAELFTYVVTEGRDYKLSNSVVQSIKTFCSMVYVHRMTISNIRRICEDINPNVEVQTKYFEALVNMALAPEEDDEEELRKKGFWCAF